MRAPDTCVTRDKSAQSFFSISATWSSGSKPNFGGSPSGADDGVEALVGADRRAFLGNPRKLQHQRFERRFLTGELVLRARDARAPASFACWPSSAFSSRRRVLEPGADRVALGAQRLDLGLQRAHFARRARAARRGRASTPLSRIARSTVSRFALMKSIASIARASARIAQLVASCLTPRPCRPA